MRKKEHMTCEKKNTHARTRAPPHAGPIYMYYPPSRVLTFSNNFPFSSICAKSLLQLVRRLVVDERKVRRYLGYCFCIMTILGLGKGIDRM